MKIADAPPAGWYPDPQGGSRLRWWEGTDWSDLYRAPPSPSELDIKAHHGAPGGGAASVPGIPVSRGAVPATTADRVGFTRRDADELIAEVRKVTRTEVDRAAEVFTQRAVSATKQIQPMISQYTNRILRWVRIAAVVAFVLLVGWIVFQTVVQVSVFEWIGDRIDNLTD